MDETAPLHASCVAVGDDAVLIFGASGAGKSSLALRLMALGATLVADDRVLLTVNDSQLVARSPASIKNLIEARGIGILNAVALDHAFVRLAIDLDQVEVERIPPRREVTLLHCHIPLLHRVDAIHLAPAILQWLHAGRSDQ